MYLGRTGLGKDQISTYQVQDPLSEVPPPDIGHGDRCSDGDEQTPQGFIAEHGVVGIEGGIDILGYGHWLMVSKGDILGIPIDQPLLD